MAIIENIPYFQTNPHVKTEENHLPNSRKSTICQRDHMTPRGYERTPRENVQQLDLLIFKPWKTLDLSSGHLVQAHPAASILTNAAMLVCDIQMAAELRRRT